MLQNAILGTQACAATCMRLSPTLNAAGERPRVERALLLLPGSPAAAAVQLHASCYGPLLLAPIIADPPSIPSCRHGRGAWVSPTPEAGKCTAQPRYKVCSHSWSWR